MKKYLLFLCLVASCIDLYSQQPRLTMPLGHMFQVSQAAYSEKDKYIVTRAESVKIWEAATGKLIKTYDFRSSPRDAYLYNNNRTLVIAYQDSIQLWDIENDRLLRTIAGNDLNVFESKNYAIVMNLHDDDPAKTTPAKLYRLTDFRLIHEFPEPIASIASDGKRFIGLDINKTVVYDTLFKQAFINTAGTMIGCSGDFEWMAIQGDSTIYILNTRTNKLVNTIKTDLLSYYNARFKPDSNLMLLKVKPMKNDKGWMMQDGNTFFYTVDMNSLQVLNRFPEQQGNLEGFEVSDDYVATSSTDSSLRVWNLFTGKLVAQIKDPGGYSSNISLSEDDRFIIATTNQSAANIWNIGKQKLQFSLGANTSYIDEIIYSANGKQVLFRRNDDTWIWDLEKATPVLTIPADPGWHVRQSALNNTGSKLYLTLSERSDAVMGVGGSFSFSTDETRKKKIVVYNTDKGEMETTLPVSNQFRHFTLHPGGKKILIANNDATAYEASLVNEKDKKELPALGSRIEDAQYIHEGKQLILITDSVIGLYDTETFAPVTRIKLDKTVTAYEYSPLSGQALVTLSDRKIVVIDLLRDSLVGIIWDFVKKGESTVYSRLISPVADSTGRFFCLKGFQKDQVIVVDVMGALGYKIIDLKAYPSNILFNNRNNLVISDGEGNLEEWNLFAHRLVGKTTSNAGRLAAIREDGKFYLHQQKADLTVIDAITNKTRYRLHVLPKTDYILTDPQNRYDGTEAARKQLYFTCGTELVELDQLKDQLWVPGLGERLMGGEAINSKTLSELNICGLTPLTETLEEKSSQYRFRITPRRGGLGETIVQVNGIEVKKIAVSQLTRDKGAYLLSIPKKDLDKYFVAGKENRVAIRAMTAGNTISSRSTVIDEEPANTNNEPPNLYAVIVGVSDYKGEELDLHYAAKDAKDFANAVEIAAKKLLNAGGGQHVFISRLHTGEGRDRFPEKNSIKQTFEEIGKKARPNDILLVFFAGHGKMDKDTRQFYFITADASKNSITSALADVSISTRELTDWIKPDVLKAQKRILIFDACNSGQAIKDFVKLGDENQHFIAARDDEKAEQVKAIEKMNEKSGLFILSASASNQSAYEMSKYSQGVLTYSLLEAIKQQPDILNDRKYLNLAKWFAAAERTVTEIAKETKSPQQAQIVSTTNFDIGVVDEEIRKSIVLPQEKPIFSSSEFRNASLKIDNLRFRQFVDRQLQTFSATGSNSQVLFKPGFIGNDIYTLSGDYTVSGNAVSVSVILIKGGMEIAGQFEISGSPDELDQLALALVNKATEAVKGKN